jgi:hypothetical protein
MRTTLTWPAIIVAAVLAGACGSAQTATTPSAPEADASASVSAPSSVTGSAFGGRGSCPANPPFGAKVDVVVAGGTGVVVTGIDVRFVDQQGIQARQVTLPAPVPTAQIGTALENARNPQRIPVEFSFGCGTGRFGTAFVTVHMTDGNGRRLTRQLTVDVR